MDELKIKSKFMRGLVSKLLSTTIYKKLGYKMDIQVNNISVVVGDKTRIHLDMNAEINNDEFFKFARVIGFEE